MQTLHQIDDNGRRSPPDLAVPISEAVKTSFLSGDPACLSASIAAIEQERERDFENSRDFVRIGRQSKALRQQSDHRLDVKTGAGEVAIQITCHRDERRRNSGFLHGLAQRRLYRVEIMRFTASAGKADLTPMARETFCSLGKEQCRSSLRGIARNNRQQYRGANCAKIRRLSMRSEEVIGMA